MSREVAGSGGDGAQNVSWLRGQWANSSGQYSIYLILVAMIVISSFLSPAFLSIANFANISRQISITTILAFGQTILIIGGMLDLSCGSVMALSGLVAVLVFKATGIGLVALCAGIATGVLANSINGLMVTTFRLPPFIATLAMLTSARGAALLLTSGQPVYQLGTFKVWGQGALFGIPTPLLFVVGILAVTWYILNHTRLGRYIYAIGGNQEAARASGIAVNRVKVIAYLINGAFVGIAGVLYMSRVNAGLPDAGQGFELDALTSSIIGGVSFSGGIGTAVGTLAGAFIVGFLGNIMNLLGIQSYVQQFIRGAIIALAVAYDIASKSRRTRKILGGASVDEAKRSDSKRAN
jgi:inositol transport system permease protein